MNKIIIINKILFFIIIIFILLLVLGPLTWIFLASLKTQNEVYLFKWFPNEAQWINYYEAWNTYDFGRYFFNTVF